FNSNFKVIPPLRTMKDSRALIKGLKSGVIDFVTTDHSPMDIEEKRVEFDLAAYGSLGLEHGFGVLNSLFGLEKAVELLGRGRERFGLETPKIQEGSPANLTLFNPDMQYTVDTEHLLSTSKNSMYMDASLKGAVYGIILRDQILT
ncbi:MAG: dihydroorotase, partial [Eudoraea sp.]|nr:dihydroorotase [Eudoraea sp.]